MNKVVIYPAVLLAVVGVLFGALHFSASLHEIGFRCIGAVGYLVPVFITWAVVEWFAKRCSSFTISKEAIVLVGAFLFLSAVVVQFAPELGQRGMAYDSWRAQRSLEAGCITHVHASVHTYWVNYELLLSFLGMLISTKLQVGQFLNVACRAFALGSFFLLSVRCFGRRAARAATLLIGFSPICTLYALTLVGDFIAAMFFLLSLHSFTCSIEGGLTCRQHIIRAALSGLLAGVGLLFKSIGFVILPAFVAGVAVYALLLQDPLRRRACWTSLLLLFATCWLFGVAVRSVRGMYSSGDESGRESFRSSILYEMRLGLDASHGGYYSQTVARRFRSLEESEQWEEVREMLSRTRRELPAFLVKKFSSIWGRDDAPGGVLYWFDATCREDPLHQKGQMMRPQWIAGFLRCEHLALAFLFLAGAAGLALSLPRHPAVDLLPGLVSLVVIMLFATMEMLIESHGRYRMVIYPFYFLVLPYCKVWLEADNPVHMKIKKLWGKIKG